MNNMYTSIEEIISNISFLSKIFDRVRIIDPLKKKVYYTSIQDSEIIDESSFCYDIWNQGKICINCISIRSIIRNETFTKIEFDGKSLFFITSVPFDTVDGKIVAEFLKNITELHLIDEIKNLTINEKFHKINEINRLIVEDELTGVYNRRFIDERLPVDIFHAHVNNKPLSIVMADLDFFKKVNDNLGHLVGDDILKLFASIISDNIRKDDWVARYGGDEFLICLHDADKDVAYEISERIRKNIQNNDEIFKKYNLKLAASFGIYTIEEGEKDYLEAIKKADEKLYKAKKKRNWVEA